MVVILINFFHEYPSGVIRVCLFENDLSAKNIYIWLTQEPEEHNFVNFQSGTEPLVN
jgi:hypothetical protein